MEKIFSFFSRPSTVVSIFLILVIFASFQSYLLSDPSIKTDNKYKAYNNYVIFSQSFHHLIDHKDLYAQHPDDQFDLFKYSPAFSVFFSIFAIQPDISGLLMWNFLNAFLLLLAVFLIRNIPDKQKSLILLICAVELMISIQNEQSNALMAALIILTYVFLEKKNMFLATLMIMLSVFIKIFGIVGFVMFLFYPKKWKAALYSIAWFVILTLLPLILIDFAQLKETYISWWNMLSNDFSSSLGYSVMGWLSSWFDFEPNKYLIILLGAVFFMLPFLRIKQYSNPWFKLLMLSSTLIWVVIFNHKAESPTFIIAMAGAAIWFFSTKQNWLNITLIIFAIAFTSLGTTDIVPSEIRNQVFIPYRLKALPLILIWIKIIYDLLFGFEIPTYAEKDKSELIS